VRSKEFDREVAKRYCEDLVRKQTSERYIVSALGMPIFHQLVKIFQELVKNLPGGISGYVLCV
jgi:hypothetical protein